MCIKSSIQMVRIDTDYKSLAAASASTTVASVSTRLQSSMRTIKLHLSFQNIIYNK